MPAAFRAELTGESFQGVVVFRSHAHPALEGFAWSYMQEISRRLENFDLFSAKQDDLATTIFGESVQLPFDGEGRVVLPPDLMSFAGLSDQASFVGLGNKFQIWDSNALSMRRAQARKNVQDNHLTLPRGGEA